MTVVAAVLALVVGAATLLSAHDLITRPGFRRIALRNTARRPGEALLVILGAMFGTAIIGASFIVGDSFDGSIRDVARTSLGPIDEIVRIRPDPSTLDHDLGSLMDRLAHATLPDIDGLLAARSTQAVLSDAAPPERRRSEPDGCMAEVDMTSARRFGHDLAATGMAGTGDGPAPGGAYVNSTTARRLGLSRGDTLVARAFGRRLAFNVTKILPTVGIAGYCGAWVAPGTIRGAATGADPGAGAPSATVFVSNTGGVFDGADRSDTVERALDRAVASVPGVSVETVKADTLDDARRTGDTLRTILTAIGGFSLVSGILLVINLFVMLAEERSRELGILRAVGMKRRDLWRVFSLEGTIYSVTSAVLGAIAALGVAALVVEGTSTVFASPGDRSDITLHIKPTTLLLAAGVGAVISLVTVWATSIRTARGNIICAIRELPTPRRARRSTSSRLGLVILMTSGISLLGSGFAGVQPALLLGLPVIAVGLATLAFRRWGRSLSIGVASVSTLVWVLGVFVFFPTLMAEPSIAVFVTMGVVAVFAAVALGSVLDPLWRAVGHTVARTARGLPIRLGLTYPLARPLRTALLLAMYALVVFTLTFLGTFSTILSTQSASSARDVSVGTDVLVDSNPANPADRSALLAVPGVAEAVGVVRWQAEFSIGYNPDPTHWPVTGIDASFIEHGVPRLSSHLARFASDRATLDAVIADPSLVVVDAQFLQSNASPPAASPEPGDRVMIANSSGESHRAVIAGVLRSDYGNSGALLQRRFVDEFGGAAVSASRSYVTIESDTEMGSAGRERAARAVAGRIQGTLVDHGVEARTFRQIVDDDLGRTASFIRLLQVYLGFGLAVGIAGLGVVMVRAVRERKREIGMLRAMGFSAAVVRRSFLVEAAFIGVQAVLTGVGLGLLTCWQLTVNAGAFSSAAVSFAVSPLQIAGVLVIPVLASLAATVIPAARAAAIRPALALRATD